jgi:hypothetical protein
MLLRGTKTVKGRFMKVPDLIKAANRLLVSS